MIDLRSDGENLSNRGGTPSFVVKGVNRSSWNVEKMKRGGNKEFDKPRETRNLCFGGFLLKLVIYRVKALVHTLNVC